MRNVNDMLADLIAFSKKVGAPFDFAAAASSLRLFEHEFITRDVELRTVLAADGVSTIVSVRYVDLAGARDPRGVWSGRIGQSSSIHADAFSTAIKERLDLQGYGVDVGLSRGVEKIWIFLAKAYPVDRIAALNGAPRALDEYVDDCFRFGLRHCHIVGFDYLHGTCNLYFSPKGFNSLDARSLVSYLDFADSDKLIPDCDETVAVNVTFDWKTDCAQRVCFYTLAPKESELPDTELARRVARHARLWDGQKPPYILGWTFSPDGFYLKVESDYSGTIYDALRKATTVPIAEEEEATRG